MAAAPQYATATFKGLQTGKTYAVDLYLSDVANAQVNWDNGNGAGTSSLTFWKAPENVVLVDFSINTGMTDTKSVLPTVDGGQIPGQRFRYANFLNSLAFRPAIQLGFKAGSNIGLLQQA